jgi:hypothetical protein
MDEGNKKLVKIIEALDAVGYRVESIGPEQQRDQFGNSVAYSRKIAILVIPIEKD